MGLFDSITKVVSGGLLGGGGGGGGGLASLGKLFDIGSITSHPLGKLLGGVLGGGQPKQPQPTSIEEQYGLTRRRMEALAGNQLAGQKRGGGYIDEGGQGFSLKKFASGGLSMLGEGVGTFGPMLALGSGMPYLAPVASLAGGLLSSLSSLLQ